MQVMILLSMCIMYPVLSKPRGSHHRYYNPQQQRLWQLEGVPAPGGEEQRQAGREHQPPGFDYPIIG